MGKLPSNSFNQLIQAVILCGGQAQRMGGIDKGLAELNHKPLLQWVIDKLTPQVHKIQINANHHIHLYEKFGYEIISDIIEGYAGPLAGFHAALSTCTLPYLLTVPCDCPLLPENLVTQMYLELEENQADLVYAATVNHEKSNALETHPVFCLMRQELLPSIEIFLKTDRKIDRWFKTLKANPVVFNDKDNFININTMYELEKVQAKIA